MDDKNRWVPWDDSLKDERDVKQLAVNDLHNELLFASAEIGGICEMANWASTGVAGRVCAAGKKLREITIGEMLDLLEEQAQYHALTEELVTRGAGGGDDQ